MRTRSGQVIISSNSTSAYRHWRSKFLEHSGLVGCASILLLALVGASSAQAQAEDIIRQMHSLRDKYSGSRPPSEPRVSRADTAEETWARKMIDQDRARAARVEKERRHFAALNASASDALQRRDFARALRHYEALRIAKRNAGIYSPDLQETIERTQARQAWSEAKTAAEYRAAINRKPRFFSAANVSWVEQLEALEQVRRERPLRDEAHRVARVRISAMVDSLAASVGAMRPTGTVLVGDARTGRRARDAFGGVKADPLRVDDDGTSGEHAAIEHGLGFDNFGRLNGEMAAPPPVPPASGEIPDDVRANAEFQQHPLVKQLVEDEALASAAEQAAAIARARYEERMAADPDAGDVLLLHARSKQADSQATNARNTVKVRTAEVIRTVNFKPFQFGSGSAKPKPATGSRS